MANPPMDIYNIHKNIILTYLGFKKLSVLS